MDLLIWMSILPEMTNNKVADHFRLFFFFKIRDEMQKERIKTTEGCFRLYLFEGVRAIKDKEEAWRMGVKTPAWLSASLRPPAHF